MECRYCHEKGHLISNCPIIKQKNQPEKQTEDVVKKSPQQVNPPSLELLQQKLNVEGLPKIPSTLKQKKQKQTEDVVKKSPQHVKPPSLELLQQKLNVEGLPKIPSTLKQKKQKQTEDVVKKSPQQAKPPSLELLQQKLNVEGLPKIPSTLPPLTWLQQPRTKTSKDKASPQQAPPPPPPPTQAPQGPRAPTYADKCKANKNNTTTTTEKKAPTKEVKSKPKRNIYKQKTTEKKAPLNPGNKNKQSWADIMDDDSDDEETEPSNFWSN